MGPPRKKHYSLERVVAGCSVIAGQIAEVYNKLGSDEINILYIKNGGSLPGEILGHMLTERGFFVNLYSPHYGRYDESGFGGKIEIKKDLSRLDKIMIAKSINRDNLAIHLDELADKGETLEFAREDIKGYGNIDEEKFSNYVFTAVLCRKPDFAALPDNNPLKASLKFCAYPDAPNRWLTFPWEKDSKFYRKKIANLVYNAPVSELREFAGTLVK